MRWLGLCLSVSALVLLCHCGLSPEAACRALATAQCEKEIECTPAAQKQLDPSLKDQASCEASRLKRLQCDNITSVCNNQPEKYSPQNAKACIDELKTLTCSDIVGGQSNTKAPSCLKVCSE